MPEYLAPGVYVEETSFRAKSIQGVGTSTTAFVGPTRGGPIRNGSEPVLPEVLTSFGEFERTYGNSADLQYGTGAQINYLAHAVRAFFDNGGARLYLARTFTPEDPNDADSGKASATIFDQGGETAVMRARNPGSAHNGQAIFYEKRTPATQKQLEIAPDGSMAVEGGNTPARPATLEGSVSQPFMLVPGDQLVLTVNGSQTTINFNATNAEATGTAIAATVNVPADTSLPVTINNGPVQAIALDAANDVPLADILNQINVRLRGGYARLEGTDQIVIGTDRAGTTASVSVGPLALLGFASAENGAGTGNVPDISAVTAAHINAALPNGLGAGVSVNGDGEVIIATEATGTAATLAAGSTPMRARLGLPNSTNTGEDGSARRYHRKANGVWTAIDGGAVLDLNQLPAGVVLVQVNVELVDAAGNRNLHENLGLYPDHPRYLGRTLPQATESKSVLLTKPVFFSASNGAEGHAIHAVLFALGETRSFPLAGGSDGLPPVGTDQNLNTQSVADALEVLEDIEDIAIIASPGHSTLVDGTFRTIQGQLIGHAERMQYRFAVLDTPPALTPGAAREVRSRIDSYRAAIYYPWIVISNPAARPGDDSVPKEIALPPSGFVTGIYARNDVSRGVWKAPANEIVRGALRFEREVNKGQQETLNPEGVNCLRFFFGRGNRIWGARTASSDPEWMYVNVVRYFIYLEHSIDRSTQWAVFEPNGERLWANITDTVSAFLFNEWRSGALLGSTPDQAYFVRCDRSTMTQADLDNGRLICEIGVAALKPAEFVIFRIGQKTADA